MPFYQELGRHTPPPPPYSQDQRKSSSTVSAYNTSQRSDPPPPPPYLNSTSITEPTIPAVHELGQTITPADSNLCQDSNDTQLPIMSYQVSGAQTRGLGQGFGDYPRNQYCESIRFGIPVEPEVIPGVRAHPLRPFDKLPLESRSQSLPHQSFVYNYPLAPRTASVDASCLTQSPSQTLATLNPQLLPLFRRHSSTNNNTSLTNTVTHDGPASLEAFPFMPPLYNLPSHPGNERRATLPLLPTSQELRSGPKVADVKHSPEPNTGRCRQHDIENPSDNSSHHSGYYYIPLATTTTLPSKAPHPHTHPASPAQLSSAVPSPRSRDFASSIEKQNRRLPLGPHKRLSAPVRFEPYKRRQSKVSEDGMGSKLGGKGDGDGDGGRSQRQQWQEGEGDSDVEMEMEEGGEGGGDVDTGS